MTLTVKATREEVEGVLSSLEGIKSYRIETSSGTETSAKVTYSGDVDLREAVSFAFSDIRRAVISMGIEEENLEEIFLKLTEGDAADAAHADDDGDDNDDDSDSDSDNDNDNDDNDNDNDNDDDGDDYKPLFGGR